MKNLYLEADLKSLIEKTSIRLTIKRSKFVLEELYIELNAHMNKG